MSRRRTARGRCSYDRKVTFPTFERARKAANRLPEQGEPYFCPIAGGWHVRRGDQAEYDRRQALRWSDVNNSGEQDGFTGVVGQVRRVEA